MVFEAGKAIESYKAENHEPIDPVRTRTELKCCESQPKATRVGTRQARSEDKVLYLSNNLTIFWVGLFDLSSLRVAPGV